LLGDLSGSSVASATRSWSATPSGQTISVSQASLALDLQRPRTDVPTQGERSPYLDSYLRNYTTAWEATAPGTFPLTVAQG
jgi:hypothetical protein